MALGEPGRPRRIEGGLRAGAYAVYSYGFIPAVLLGDALCHPARAHRTNGLSGGDGGPPFNGGAERGLPPEDQDAARDQPHRDDRAAAAGDVVLEWKHVLARGQAPRPGADAASILM